ncbi:hypothetical protein G6F57_023031 [Rhizopus arrhizus]|nr:hypothetical protein G6F57_023031 [Rhizopus arrhizus]
MIAPAPIRQLRPMTALFRTMACMPTRAPSWMDAGFLDIGAVADQDGVVVAADRYVGPDADARFQRDVADDVGTVGHVGGGVDAGDQVVKLVNGHCLRSPVASRGRRGPCRR